jgi:hypothetical protein
MKFVELRSFADPDAAARKLIEIASTIEPVQDGRIYVEFGGCTHKRLASAFRHKPENICSVGASRLRTKLDSRFWQELN